MQSEIEDGFFLGFENGLGFSTREGDDDDKLSIQDDSFILPDEIGDKDDAYKKLGALYIGKEEI